MLVPVLSSTSAEGIIFIGLQCLVSINQVITPWDVQGGADGKVDYNKLIEQVTTAAAAAATAAVATAAAGAG
jgi:hypothetical protein